MFKMTWRSSQCSVLSFVIASCEVCVVNFPLINGWLVWPVFTWWSWRCFLQDGLDWTELTRSHSTHSTPLVSLTLWLSHWALTQPIMDNTYRKVSAVGHTSPSPSPSSLPPTFRQTIIHHWSLPPLSGLSCFPAGPFVELLMLEMLDGRITAEITNDDDDGPGLSLNAYCVIAKDNSDIF